MIRQNGPGLLEREPGYYCPDCWGDVVITPHNNAKCCDCGNVVSADQARATNQPPGIYHLRKTDRGRKGKAPS